MNDIVKFIARHERDVRNAKVAPTVGCNHGFRKAARFCSAAELASLRVGENNALYRALIHNGKHPAYKNGSVLLLKYRRMLDRARRAA